MAMTKPVSNKTTKAVAIACQGGGSQAAYTAGVVSELLGFLDDEKRWIGISGTSGGAITAAAAYCGMLLGGVPRAQRALEDLWDHNTAQRPGEVLLNDFAVRTLESLSFDFQLNPNLTPMRQVNAALSALWPLMATTFPPLAAWARPGYFKIEDLIESFVDFPLLEALGRFLAIPATIDAWRMADLLDGKLARPDQQEERRLQLAQNLRSAVTAGELLVEAANNNPDGLLAAAFRKVWPGRQEEFIRRFEKTLATKPVGEPGLDSIRAGVKALVDELPVLLVGAVDAGTGEFVAFNSKRHPDDRGITLDAIRASAAIPWLFPGVEIMHAGTPHVYWDGLFSQNPPIADFFAGVGRDAKPDEIWVAQVNPQRCRREDLDKQLWDRRNELSGNLSLNQEIASAHAINARIDSNDDDKRVQILRIAMDSVRLEEELQRSLGPASKLDRSAELKDRLLSHGKAQVQAFIPVRNLIELEWNAAQARPTMPVEGLPDGGISALRKAFGGHLHFNLSDMTIETLQEDHFGGKAFEGEVLRVGVSWYCHVDPEAIDGNAASGERQRQRLQGIAVIGLGRTNDIVGVRMTNIQLSQSDMATNYVNMRTLRTKVAA